MRQAFIIIIIIILLVRCSRSVKHLSSADSVSTRSNSYTLRWQVFREGKSGIWWFKTIQNWWNQVLVDDKWIWPSTSNKITICDAWRSRKFWQNTQLSALSHLKFCTLIMLQQISIIGVETVYHNWCISLIIILSLYVVYTDAQGMNCTYAN